MVGLGGVLAIAGLLWMTASLRSRSDSSTLPTD